MSVSKRIFVTSSDSITQNENNLVNLTTADGQSFEALEPRRLFPVNDRDRYISFLDADGHEVAILREMASLDAESAAVLCRVLDEYYVIPQITEVIEILEKGGMDTWTVMTDRGKCTFRIRSRVNDIKSVEDGRILFRDSSDNRYEVRDWTKLDKHSRHLLNAYV